MGKKHEYMHRIHDPKSYVQILKEERHIQAQYEILKCFSVSLRHMFKYLLLQRPGIL